MRRLGPLVVSVGVVAAVALPVLRGPGHDSYPLSTYPMFARDRGAVSVVETAVALDEEGNEIQLRPRHLGGTHEPVHAAMTLARAVAEGRAQRLCQEIAGRVERSGVRGAQRVEVVTVAYDNVAWFAGSRTPLWRLVRADCDVEP